MAYGMAIVSAGADNRNNKRTMLVLGSMFIFLISISAPSLGNSIKDSCIFDKYFSVCLDAHDVVSGSCACSGSIWTQSGTDIYYTGGKVGIGTTNPNRELYVAGTIYAHNGYHIRNGYSISTGTANKAYINFYDDLKLDTGQENYNVYIGDTGTSSEYVTVTALGRVGINNTSPTEYLDVNGNVTAWNFIEKSSYFTGDAIPLVKATQPEDSKVEWSKPDYASFGDAAVIYNYTVPTTERQNVTDCYNLTTTKNSTEVCEEVEKDVVIGYEEKTFEGVSMNMKLAILWRANQQLIERIEQLEDRLP